MTFQSVSDQDQILIQCDLILAYTFLLHFIPNHIFYYQCNYILSHSIYL